MTNTPFIYKYQPQYLNDFQVDINFKNMLHTLLAMDNINIFLKIKGLGISSRFREERDFEDPD